MQKFLLAVAFAAIAVTNVACAPIPCASSGGQCQAGAAAPFAIGSPFTPGNYFDNNK